MSMPIWPLGPTPPDGFTLPDAIASILYSIALEELGLSHIMNTEGEKIQRLLGTIEGLEPLDPEPTIGQILMANQSVSDMLMTVLMNEMVLSVKMAVALDAYFKGTDLPTPPQP